MSVRLVSHTPDPEGAIELAYLSCRNADPWKPKYKIPLEVRIDAIWHSGHHSVLEFADATFYVSGVSRSCSHQFVRHRLASYAQLSMRYVEPDVLRFIVPDSLTIAPEKYTDIAGSARDAYIVYRSMGVEKEDARFTIPIGIETRFMVKMNFRSWLHFLKLRTHPSAQWEIRDIADQIHNLLKGISPNIFADKYKELWQYV